MPVAVEFANPWWLLALPLVPALLVFARLPYFVANVPGEKAKRRKGERAKGKKGQENRLFSFSLFPPSPFPLFPFSPTSAEWRRLGLRLAWTALLVLALAGTSLTRPLHRQAILFVVDASASMTPVRDQAEAAVQTALAELAAGDLAGVVAAAASARVEASPEARPVFHRLAVALAENASDLASGLRLAAALLPEGYTGRVVLVSDGRQTRGDAVAAARDLAGRGATVDVLPLGIAVGPDLRLESVEFPETAYRGEVAVLTARLFAGRATAATIRVYRDDALVLEREANLRNGRQEVAVPVPVGEPGLHRYRVDLAAADPSADAIAVNNTLGAIQRVVGPPRVLVVASGPAAAGLLPGALQAGGAEVTIATPAGIPADLAGLARYDVVVLADVPADSLPPGTPELLEAYVRDLGRGLVMTGGADSFGPGGYAHTPVEQALPVYMDVRGRGRQPRVALALVIDRSGSMSGTKMELAKEAAVRSVRLLRPDDRAAVLGFDSAPQWVAPLTPLTDRAQLERAIGSIYAGGGTEIYPAVAAGFAALREVEADVKHMILLTDGRSGSGGEYVSLLQQMREARVSLSTVAVGEDADTGLLEAMARAGRGRYHFTTDPASVPQIFTRETIMATRTILVDARFDPAAASGGPILHGLSAVPPLDGYVAVTPKERSEVVLVSPEGDPVLAAWQYGTGRAVAWTPDLAGRWSRAWDGSPAATALWGNILSWLLPPQRPGELAVRVVAEGDGAFAVVAENSSGWDQVRPTRAAALGPAGKRQEIELAPAGPGRYRARLETPEPGAYVVQVTQASDGGREQRAEAGWVAPYPAEYREAGVDQALLARVAAAGGGRVLAGPAEAAAPPLRPAVARWPLWPLLLVLAALLWPLEIASRRLLVPSATAWLPLARPRAHTAGEGPEVSEPARKPAATTPPAASTAQRLLDRKRAYREGRQ